MAVRRDVEQWLPPAILVLVAVLASYPFLAGKYVFLLDQVAGPNWSPVASRLFGFRTAAYGGSLPIYAILEGISWLGSPAVAQKVLFVGVIALTAGVGYHALPGNRVGRTYGAVLLLVNPFVYARLIAGQWAVVWGVATIPLVVWTFATYLETGRPRSLLAAVGAILLLSVSAHLLYAAGILLVAIVAFRALDRRDLVAVRRGLTVGLVSLPVNAYWLGPALFSPRGTLAGVVPSDLLTYTPQSEFANPLFAVASMHGFWRGGIRYARDLAPPVLVLYAVILFFAVYGFLVAYESDRGYVVKALGVTALLALPLSAGASGPTAPLYEWLFESVPFFAGMRDSGKFVALIVVAYAALGALGTSALIESVRRFEGKQWATKVAVVLVLLVPLAYTFPMVTGYAGQIHTDDYPAEWDEVDQYLESQQGQGTVLVLPWHQYTSYSWIDGRREPVATPARAFFSRPVLQGDNVEAGSVYSTSGNTLSHYVEFLFGLGPGNERLHVSNMGELLAHANVKYVVLTTDADWRYYDEILTAQRDLTLVREGEHVVVYRNDREVDRGFGTSNVVSVRDWSQFVSVSQRQDTTDSVVVLDDETTGGSDARSAERTPLAVEEHSPVSYRMAGSERRYSVFSRPHQTAGDQWRYDGTAPESLHLGFQPVFESGSGPAEVRYAPFYRLYLPSYGVSALAVLALLGYGMAHGLDTRPVTRGLKRLRVTAEKARFDDND